MTHEPSDLAKARWQWAHPTGLCQRIITRRPSLRKQTRSVAHRDPATATGDVKAATLSRPLKVVFVPASFLRRLIEEIRSLKVKVYLVANDLEEVTKDLEALANDERFDRLEL